MSENVFTTTAVSAEDADLLYLASQAEGRRFLWSLVERCGLWSPSFDLSERVEAYREGRRSVAIELVEVMKARVPRQYVLMVQEATDRAAKELAASAAASAQAALEQS